MTIADKKQKVTQQGLLPVVVPKEDDVGGLHHSHGREVWPDNVQFALRSAVRRQ